MTTRCEICKKHFDLPFLVQIYFRIYFNSQMSRNGGGYGRIIEVCDNCIVKYKLKSDNIKKIREIKRFKSLNEFIFFTKLKINENK